ncbi:hypothetical protein TRIP_B200002 [uncultured Desulfatiglans sp.]|uniref:Uncharacterized protein n=1 Tax=Uncultured Desulfatiglans sp. TaxID=1748965 RepID=A0A653A2I0_UNCDX|nr:hypothetical protein TRIP_B200002 [uncultured Desulfatiglans sp.]
MPKSIATKSVRGEQKTFDINKRRYPINSTPLKETTQPKFAIFFAKD